MKPESLARRGATFSLAIVVKPETKTALIPLHLVMKNSNSIMKKSDSVIVDVLIEDGADPNARNKFCSMSLHWVMSYSDPMSSMRLRG